MSFGSFWNEERSRVPDSASGIVRNFIGQMYAQLLVQQLHVFRINGNIIVEISVIFHMFLQ
jgi:hypothetical protein